MIIQYLHTADFLSKFPERVTIILFINEQIYILLYLLPLWKFTYSENWCYGKCGFIEALNFINTCIYLVVPSPIGLPTDDQTVFTINTNEIRNQLRTKAIFCDLYIFYFQSASSVLIIRKCWCTLKKHFAKNFKVRWLGPKCYKVLNFFRVVTRQRFYVC